MPATGVLADHKNNSYHGQDTALHIQALFITTRTLSSFHQLAIKKTGFSSLSIESLKSLRAVTHISHGTLAGVCRLHLTGICPQRKYLRKSPNACLLHISAV